MKVLILAGGFATRLWPLTEKKAKPLLLLDGKTILAHILEKIPNNLEIILLTNKKFEQSFKNEVKNLDRGNIKIFCEDSFSDGEKLGALGAISVAIKEFKINENILVFAGDNLLPELQIEQLFCSEDDAKIAVRELENFYNARNFGVVEVRNERREMSDKKEEMVVTSFEEKPENPKSKLVSTGFLSIGKNLFSILHDFVKKSPDALGGIFPEFLRLNKKVFAVKIYGEWFDIGSFETYLSAHEKLQKEPLKQQKNVEQHTNKFSGKVFLGEGSIIKNCRISDSIIYLKCHLENCHISRSVIDKNCDLIGLDLNCKLVREGTKIGI